MDTKHKGKGPIMIGQTLHRKFNVEQQESHYIRLVPIPPYVN